MSVSLRITVIPESSSGQGAVLVVARAVSPADAPVSLHSRCFSPDEVLRRVSGDILARDEILDAFQSEHRRWLDAIEHAVRTRDPGAIARAAHRLRGALLNLSAGPAARATMEIENCGRGGMVPAAASVDSLAVELDRLTAAITQFRGVGVGQ